jgi:hypothetical protein
MSNVLQNMLDSGYIKPDELEKVGERVADFMEELQADPELLDEALQKLGADPGFWDSVGKGFRRAMPLTLAAAASTAAVAGASGLAHEAVEAIRNSLGKAKAYKAMIDHSGDRLEGIPAEKVQESFNTLYRFNPQVAADPAVAAEFIRETSRTEAYPFQLLRAVSDMKQDPGKGSWLDYKSLVPSVKMDSSSK